MSELPIAWLDTDGVVHDAYRQVQLALNGCTVDDGLHNSAVTPDGRCIICVVEQPSPSSSRPVKKVMAYSLQNGAELWPAAVEGNSVVGVVGSVVWVADSRYEAPCTARCLASGKAVMTLPNEGECAYTAITAGPWKGHMLGRCYCDMSFRHVALYAPGSTDQVWQVDVEGMSVWVEHCLTTGGEWFCLEGCGFLRLYSLRDGQPVASVFDSLRYVSFSSLVAVYDPNHVLVSEVTVRDVHGRREWIRQHMMLEAEQIAMLPRGDELSAVSYESQHILPPRDTAAFEVIVCQGECIQIVIPAAAVAQDVWSAPTAGHWPPPGVATATRRPAPGVVAAWHWPLIDCARRECDSVAVAVAAVDGLPCSAANTGVGLVRAALVGFVAEDARLLTLQQ